jgi:hypothetical protein
MKARSVLVAVCIVLACMVSTASAALISIDLNGVRGTATPVTYSGAAVIGAAGDVWNGYTIDNAVDRPVTPPQSGFLFDSTGAATTVKFQTGPICGDEVGGLGNALVNDVAYVRGPIVDDPGAPLSTTLTLSGLAGNYDVYLYAGAGHVKYSADFTIGSVTKGTAYGSVFAGSWVEGTNYVKFSNVPTTGGILEITFAGDADNPYDGGYAVCNGLQIQSIPEPSTLILLIGGLIGFLAYAWKRRK